jgi:hypothetical protein
VRERLTYRRVALWNLERLRPRSSTSARRARERERERERENRLNATVRS